jgi:hypothetical protein
VKEFREIPSLFFTDFGTFFDAGPLDDVLELLVLAHTRLFDIYADTDDDWELVLIKGLEKSKLIGSIKRGGKCKFCLAFSAFFIKTETISNTNSFCLYFFFGYLSS